MNEITDLSFDQLDVGLAATMTWTVTTGEIDDFAVISGDTNPLHMNAGYAKSAGFPHRVAHGFLLGAKVSGFIGTQLPGRRCLLLEQSLAFPNPVFAGDVVTIRGEASDLWPDQALVRIKIRATAARENPKVVGRGWVLCRVLS